MKKLKTLLLLPLLLLASCNKQVFDFNLKFNKVHVFEAGACYPIESWTDYEDGDQIQVKISGKGTCLFHANSIILVADKCPICN